MVLELELNVRLSTRGRKVAAKAARRAVCAARHAIQGKRYGVEDGRLARARVSADEIEALAAESLEVDGHLARVGPERADGKLGWSHLERLDSLELFRHGRELPLREAAAVLLLVEVAEQLERTRRVGGGAASSAMPAARVRALSYSRLMTLG